MFFYFLNSIVKYGKIQIIDFDNSIHTFGSTGPYCKIKFHNKSVKRKLLFNPELYVGELYVDKELSIEEGTLEIFIDIITKNEVNIHKNIFHRLFYILSSRLYNMIEKNYIGSSKKNVQHHYDIDESVYKLFLDKDMQYSCGYFHNDNVSLDQAQIDKKTHLIKKLNIKKEKTKVLDIGSGWGGMALQIAKDTGSYVKGITLSNNQYDTSVQRTKKMNLENLVSFKIEDYRNIKEKYDRIISVGMFEHVGKRNYSVFFKKIKEILEDDGVMVLHSIGNKEAPAGTNPWITRYIFPGGYIPSMSEVIKEIENVGLFVNDVEILRLHYANTLKLWRRNFLHNKDKILNILDEKFIRMWEFYLLTSEYSFRNMGNVVFQLVISKKQEAWPLTRNFIYN